jgi:acetylornithine deacetylase
MSDVIELLRELVAIPSVSGGEEIVRDHLVNWLGARGVAAEAHGRNVIATVEGTAPRADDARGLLLCTHTDVVPVGNGWTRDPWDAALEDGRVFGAMAVTAATIDPSQLSGRLVLALVCDEETGGEGIEACAADLPAYTAAVVGEPTGLDVCPGQRGLLRARITARGKSCHASRPWEGSNALTVAARDVLAVQALQLPGKDPLLGSATLECTVISGGERHNVIPAECTIELDGRPTPGCDNDAMIALLQDTVDGEVTVSSTRFKPVSTDTDSELVTLARAASPTGVVRGFGGLSDLFHLRHVPGVVMGPGTSEASHAPDEWVAVEQVEAAVAAYSAIATNYLRAGHTASHQALEGAGA